MGKQPVRICSPKYLLLSTNLNDAKLHNMRETVGGKTVTSAHSRNREPRGTATIAEADIASELGRMKCSWMAELWQRSGRKPSQFLIK
jgi:hypothetical protein